MSVMEQLEKPNFLDTNHTYTGTRSEAKAYFLENVAEYLRKHLLSDFSGHINVAAEKGDAVQCQVAYPYNLSLTFVINDGNICTAGSQNGHRTLVSSDALHRVIGDFVSHIGQKQPE